MKPPHARRDRRRGQPPSPRSLDRRSKKVVKLAALPVAATMLSSCELAVAPIPSRHVEMDQNRTGLPNSHAFPSIFWSFLASKPAIPGFFTNAYLIQL